MNYLIGERTPFNLFVVKASTSLWPAASSGRTVINGIEYTTHALEKKLHSTDSTVFGQTVNYVYNERGWLKASSSDLFSQELKYNDGSQPQYNGNISAQVFMRYNLTQPSPSPVTDTYSYSYDHLDRLTEGSMLGDKGRETLTYDHMGNILSLQRTDATSLAVDRLGHSYSGHRLSSVMDTATNIGRASSSRVVRSIPTMDPPTYSIPST